MPPPKKQPEKSSPQPQPELPLLPDPELLRHYSESFGPEIVPAIISEFRAFGVHWREAETARENHAYDLRKREQRIQGWAQLFAFLIAITAIGGGLLLAWATKTVAGSVTGGIITGGTVVSIIYSFLKARKAVLP